MAIKKTRRYKAIETPRWMVTYADMVTLLLCLFILLYATGKATPQEVQLILSAFNNSLGLFTGGQTLFKGHLEEMGLSLETLPSKTRGNSLATAKKQARSIFQPEIKTKKIRVTEDERGIIISLVSADYFVPGSALLTPDIRRVLQKASKLTKDLRRYVRVEGHSSSGEDEAISNNRTQKSRERLYQNSWDISSARAIHAATFMQQQGVPPSWLQTVGYGSYRPIAAIKEGTPEFDAYNRRIDLVLLTFKSSVRSKSEPNYGLPENRLPNIEATIEN